MPSPDVRNFVDLTLYDLDSQSIYLRALDYMKVVFPEFEPTEGSLESVILQSVAMEVADLVTSINRLPGGVVQVLLRLFDVQRQEGVPPTAVVQLKGATTTSYAIPAGTRLFYQSTLNSTPLVLVTDTATTLTHPKTVSSVSVTDDVATVTTSDYHGFAVGQTVTLAGFTDTDFNDSFEIDSVGDKTFTFAIVKANTSETPTSATATPPLSHPATAFVQATGTFITDGFNGIPSGTALDLLSVVPQIASAYLASVVSGGLNTEDDDTYFQRASANLARVNDSLVTADNFTQWVVTSGDFADVYRATAVDAADAERQESAGSVLLVVAPIDASSTNLISGDGTGISQSSPSWGVKDEIRLAASQRSHPLLDINVSDPMLATVSCAVSLSPFGSTTGTAVSALATSVIEGIVNPNTWDWSTTLRKNDIIAAVSATTDENGGRAVAYVTSVEISLDDVVVPASGAKNKPSATFSLASTTWTCTVSAGHDMDSSDTNYFAVYHSSTGWWLKEVTVTSSTQFTFSNTGIGSTTPTDWAIVGYVDSATGDLILDDQAPLVVSGSHVITVV
jgi:hypothetical protein